MAGNEQKFIYTLEAQYKGSGELGRLKDDLKSLQQVESMKKLGADVLELNRRFREARTELEKQAREMKAADTVTKEMTANYRKAQTEVGRLAEQLNRKQQAYRQSRETVRAAGIDTAKLAVEEKKLADAARATGEVWSARQALGVRAHRDVRDEILRLRTAYDTLRSSGTLTSRELIQAKQQLNTRIKELSANTTAWGTSLSRVQTGLLGMAGAFLGFQSIAGMARMLKEAETAAYGLESSLMAANREFSNIGDADSWGATIDRLSEKLRVYSKSDLTAAAAATIDMTKRLGLSREQMEMVIERTADLAAGKTDLKGGIDRVTAALRGEAEASEFLGLTLNETYVKAWHEAHNASGIAWKDLTDLEKAQVRYNVFLEQAEPLAGKAANSIKTMGGAYALAKAEIHNAVSENENATEAMTSMATAIAANADEIGDLAGMVITVAAEIMKFVLANKEAVMTIGLVTTGSLTLAMGISSLTTIWGGLNGVMMLITGSQMVPWLASVVTGLRGVQLAALSTSAAMGAVSGASLALIGGYKLGAKIAEWEYFRDVIGANKDALAEVPEKFAAITKATGVTIKSFKDLDKAQKDGLIQYNQATGAWEKVTAAAQSSAAAQKAATKGATEAMKADYKRYGDEVKRVHDQIANMAQSLADRLREMDRSGMSDMGAWQDRKNQAAEYAEAAKRAAEEAKRAFAAGDETTGRTQAEKAVEYYGKAEAAAADLNREVRDGDQVISTQQQNLATARQLVQEYGQAAIEVQKQVEAAMAAAGQSLDAQSGGQLSQEFPEIARQLGELKEQADGLASSSEEFNEAWANAWDRAVLGGKDAVAQLESELKELTRDRHIKVYVEEVDKKSSGGQIGGYMNGGMIGMAGGGYLAMRNMLRGGHFPGFGGGDRRHVVAEDGEYMFDKFRVRHVGIDIVRAFHRGRYADVVAGLMDRFNLNIGDVIHRKIGGAINRLDEARSAAGPQYMAAGGQVDGGGDVMTVNLNFGRKVIPVTTTRTGAHDLIAEFRRAEAMSS